MKMSSIVKKFKSIISIEEIPLSLLKISVFSLLLGLLIVLLDNIFFFTIQDKIFSMQKDIYLAFMALSATFVGFLISASAIISSFSISGILKKALVNGTFSDVIDYMYITKKVYTLLFAISTTGLFLMSYPEISKILLYFLISFTVVAIFLTFYSIKILEQLTKISIIDKKKEIEIERQKSNIPPVATLEPKSDGFIGKK